MRIFISYLFLFLTEGILARAGGGGGHSNNSGGHSGRVMVHNDNSGGGGILIIIALVAFAIYSIVLTYLHFVKQNKSNRIIEKAVQQDEIWNLVEIKKHTFDVFCKMQKSWENRMLGSVKSLITTDLYNELDEKIRILRLENKKNILENIVINQITLISCIDFKDNSKDEYTAQIDGEMIDYTIDDKGKAIIENENKVTAGFTDSYQFVRMNNKWILNKIYNDIGIFNLMDTKSHFEK